MEALKKCGLVSSTYCIYTHTNPLSSSLLDRKWCPENCTSCNYRIQGWHEPTHIRYDHKSRQTKQSYHLVLFDRSINPSNDIVFHYTKIHRRSGNERDINWYFWCIQQTQWFESRAEQYHQLRDMRKTYLHLACEDLKTIFDSWWCDDNHSWTHLSRYFCALSIICLVTFFLASEIKTCNNLTWVAERCFIT